MGVKLKKHEREKVGRNDPCYCGSGLKLKHCHEDSIKRMICSKIANEAMVHLILKEKHKKGMISDEEYQAFLDKTQPVTDPEPVKESDVDELMEDAGLKRCDNCKAPIPDDKELCIKCEKLNEGETDGKSR